MGCFSKPKEAKSVSTTETKTPAQTAGVDTLLNMYMKEAGTGQDFFPGPTVAPFSDTQQALFSTLGQYTPKLGPVDMGEIPLYQDTLTTTQNLLSGQAGAQPFTPKQTEDFITEAIAKPRRFAFEDIIRPLTREAYSGPGFWGSGRADAEIEAGQDVERDIAQQGEEMRWGVEQFNKELEQEKARVSLATLPAAIHLQTMPENIRSQRLDDMAQALVMASPQQLYEQAIIDESIERFAADQRLTDPEDLNILLALLGLNFSTSTGVAVGPKEAGLGFSLLQQTLLG